MPTFRTRCLALVRERIAGYYADACITSRPKAWLLEDVLRALEALPNAEAPEAPCPRCFGCGSPTERVNVWRCTNSLCGEDRVGCVTPADAPKCDGCGERTPEPCPNCYDIPAAEHCECDAGACDANMAFASACPIGEESRRMAEKAHRRRDCLEMRDGWTCSLEEPDRAVAVLTEARRVAHAALSEGAALTPKDTDTKGTV